MLRGFSGTCRWMHHNGAVMLAEWQFVNSRSAQWRYFTSLTRGMTSISAVRNVYLTLLLPPSQRNNDLTWMKGAVYCYHDSAIHHPPCHFLNKWPSSHHTAKEPWPHWESPALRLPTLDTLRLNGRTPTWRIWWRGFVFRTSIPRSTIRWGEPGLCQDILKILHCGASLSQLVRNCNPVHKPTWARQA